MTLKASIIGASIMEVSIAEASILEAGILEAGQPRPGGPGSQRARGWEAPGGLPDRAGGARLGGIKCNHSHL
ncbi:MAG: hypothetical protein D6809_06060 [Gammaproteobacteria bacterium]|nr:MAG: hypothetical protein D6809_06060 [Gammaproteobacteria bacterium]